MIDGERVHLRTIEKDDIPRYSKWINDLEVVDCLEYYRPRPMAEIELWFNKQLNKDCTQAFAIELNGKHIGFCQLEHIRWHSRQAELFILIGAKEYWNKGLGTDAIKALLNYSFRELNLHRIYIRIIASNKRAIRCCEKCGFVEEGVERETRFRHGRYVDVIRMSILEQEFHSLNRGSEPYS